MQKILVIMATSGLCLGAVTLITPQKVTAGEARRKQSSPASVANALDKIIQPRFHKDSGKFGITRMGLPGHTNALGLREEVAKDKSLLKAVKHSGHAYAIGFFRCAHKPGTHFVQAKDSEGVPPKPEPRLLNRYWTVGITKSRKYFSNGEDGVAENEAAQWEKNYQPSVEKACIKALPTLKQGKNVDTHYKNWFIAMRPIRATEEKCLSCHEGAKLGDTLGVLVYSVR